VNDRQTIVPRPTDLICRRRKIGRMLLQSREEPVHPIASSFAQMTRAASDPKGENSHTSPELFRQSKTRFEPMFERSSMGQDLPTFKGNHHSQIVSSLLRHGNAPLGLPRDRHPTVLEDQEERDRAIRDVVPNFVPDYETRSIYLFLFD